MNVKNIRLLNQQLVKPQFDNAYQLIDWFGMLQAQDYQMFRTAVVMRTKNKSLDDFFKAYDSAQIVRTHLFRCTWQVVTAKDYWWMAPLCADKNKKAIDGYGSYGDRHISEKDYVKSQDIIYSVLSDHEFLTKDELTEKCARKGLSADEHTMSVYIRRAEQDGLIINGNIHPKQNTYALIEKRLKDRNTVSYEESLKLLARKYFRSHSPATFEDFLWWTGLTSAQCHEATEAIKDELTEIKHKDAVLYIHKDSRTQGCKNTTLLLPSYDEYIIGYKTRNFAVEDEFKSKAYTSNGIFRPVIVKNGQVIGVWSRSGNKTSFFKPEYQTDVKNAFEDYENIMKKK